MNLLGLSLMTILGLVMAVTGLVGIVYFLTRYRRTRSRLEEEEIRDPDEPPNTFASLWVLNGFLHLGMLLLIIGGAGLIYYGQR